MFKNIMLKLALACIILPQSTVLADVFAARTLRVGVIVERTDLTNMESDTSASDFIGKEVKRSIYVGREVSKADLGPVTVVDRNELIRLFYYINGLEIRTEARALEAGGVGEEISVMNVDTRVTVRALITGTKRARVSR